MSYTDRLDRLAAMDDNWDGRGSAAPSDAAIRTARNIAACPLGSGGLQVEMHAGGCHIEIEIDALGSITNLYWSKA